MLAPSFGFVALILWLVFQTPPPSSPLTGQQSTQLELNASEVAALASAEVPADSTLVPVTPAGELEPPARGLTLAARLGSAAPLAPSVAPITSRGTPTPGSSAASRSAPAPTSTALPRVPTPTVPPATLVPTPTAAPQAAAVAPPARPLRVGLQAGHWLADKVPPELSFLRGSTGASGGGKMEWEINLAVAQQAAQVLQASGVAVDILNTTLPKGYKADVFIAIHADGAGPTRRGFKIARPAASDDPARDDRLVRLLDEEYGRATNLPRDYENVTAAMRYYYAFGEPWLASNVPAAIVELGFMTTPSELRLLIDDPERPGQGIARGVLRFLGIIPS